jgi:hypothetical protein
VVPAHYDTLVPSNQNAFGTCLLLVDQDALLTSYDQMFSYPAGQISFGVGGSLDTSDPASTHLGAQSNLSTLLAVQGGILCTNNSEAYG